MAKTSSPEALEALRAELAKLPQIEHVQVDSAWAKTTGRPAKVGTVGSIDAGRPAELLRDGGGVQYHPSANPYDAG